MHHPGHAKAVGNHAEAGREKSLLQRHKYGAPVRKRCKIFFGLSITLNIEGKHDPLERRISKISAIRHQYYRFTYANGGVAYFFPQFR